MKVMKKLAALLLAGALAATAALPAFAGTTTPHTIKITTNGKDVHTYGAYQIFVGNLDASGEKLSNVAWGSDATDAFKTALATAIAADNTLSTLFNGVDLTKAQAVADKLGTVTDEGAAAKAFADAVNTALDNAKPTYSASTSNTVANINVTGDGYYFIKDLVAVDEYDTYTRFMLQVVGNIDVKAKDTVLTPDKEIVAEDGIATDPATGVKDNDASIGDVITYNVTIPVPDTTQYKDHFVLHMTDTLEAGLTYFGNMTISVNSEPVTTLTSGTNYTTTVNTGDEAFTVPDSVDAAVNTTGGQKVKVVFNNFKAFAEADYDATTDGVQNLIGKTITISYQVVLNKNATFGTNSNDNDVYFQYSNNPNYDYDGDGLPKDDSVIGKTPDSITKTFVTTLELDKVDGANKQALAGAEFLLTGTSWNNVLATGEKFEKAPYTATEGETIQTGTTYYLLKDGTYTTTEKTNLTAAQYEDTTDTYVKVTYAKVVKKAKDVSLTLVTDEEGHIIIEGIEQGTYTLKETKAPTGYNLDETEYKLVIDWTNPDAENASAAVKDAGGFSKGAGSDENFTMSKDGGKFSITITNNSGSTLPSTGGMGTTLFYVIGGLLIVAAAIVIISKRRVQEG